ncbi:beta-galactosidase [Plantactinospora veratri]
MLPHAGTDSKIWREVVQLGRHLRALAEIEGSRTEAEVAVLLDYSSVWAQEAANQPSTDMVAFDEIRRWHSALWRAGITADLAAPGADLTGYKLVLAPALYLVDDAAIGNLTGYVRSGGTLVVGPYSGLVDECDRVRPAPLPGGFAELLGIRVEEFFPLPAAGTVRLDDGTSAGVWTEALVAADAEVLVRYDNGPVAGGPAVTRRGATHVADPSAGEGGAAWYLGTRLEQTALGRLLARIAEQAGVAPVAPAVPGVEQIRRRHPDGRSYLFLLNRSGRPAEVDAAGTDLLTGVRWAGRTTVEPHGVAVLAQRPEPEPTGAP